MPKEVLSGLPGRVDALGNVLADEQIGGKKHVDARQSLRSVMRARLKTIRGLDTVARSVFRTDPDKLAAWKHARRWVRRRNRNRQRHRPRRRKPARVVRA
jgi:hypothetical protein